MSNSLSDLREYRSGNDEDLFLLGFDLWEEPTTDSVRWIHFSTKLGGSAKIYMGGALGNFPSGPDHELRLCIRYTLAISDVPSGSMSDNLDYCFEGVSLEVVNLDSHDPVAAFPANIETVSELKHLIGAFRTI